MAKKSPKTPSIDTVSEASVEASIQAKSIGQKIRRLRLKRSMGLVELGEQVGLSASFLSQLETGRVVPTLRNLARIAMVFNQELSDFFSEEGETVFRLSRTKDRIRLLAGQKDATFVISDSLSVLVPDRSMVPCVVEFLPGVDGAAFDPQSFPGLELVYVIDGSLTVSTGDKTELLHAQDSAWLDGFTKRKYRCHEDRPAKALIVTFSFQL